MLIHLTVKKLKTPTAQNTSSLELFVDSPADFMRSLTSIRVRGRVTSLMLAATLLGCGSYKGIRWDSGEQAEERRHQRSMEVHVLLCCLLGKEDSEFWCLFSGSYLCFLFSYCHLQTRKPTEAICICPLWERWINYLLPLHANCWGYPCLPGSYVLLHRFKTRSSLVCCPAKYSPLQVLNLV